MKRIVAVVLCLSATTGSLCGCVRMGDTPSVETSIVYIHDSPSEYIYNQGFFTWMI